MGRQVRFCCLPFPYPVKPPFYLVTPRHEKGRQQNLTCLPIQRVISLNSYLLSRPSRSDSPSSPWRPRGLPANFCRFFGLERISESSSSPVIPRATSCSASCSSSLRYFS